MKTRINHLHTLCILLILTAAALTGSAGSGACQVPVQKGTLVFTRYNSQLINTQIYSMSTDGTHLTQLTTALPGIAVRFPSWSPDGSRILFVVKNGATFILALMLADGSQSTALTTSNEPINRPVWSPDGRWIAFGMGNGIYLLDMNARKRLPALLYSGGSAGTAAQPTWHPNSQRLAFSCTDASSGTLDIYCINVNGSGLKNLTRTPGVGEGCPAWSPDGNSIAYVQSGFFFSDGNLLGEIYRMDAEGSNRIQITNTGGACFGAPAWSPDGAWIAYSAGIFNGQDKIFATLLFEGYTVLLTDGSGYDYFPAWKR